MDIKTLNTTVAVNNIVYDKNIEQPIDVEFSLPDYCPEITKILKCRAITRISGKGINGQIISIDGNVCITVLYSDENGDVYSYEHVMPFGKSIDAGQSMDGGTVICKTNTEYLNCRAVTKRKLELHGAAGLIIKVECKKSSEILCDAEGADIKINSGTAPATVPMGSAEKNLIIEEEFDIGQQRPAVKSIIRYDAEAIVTESKIIGNKAVVKGDFKLYMLYCPEGASAPQSFEQTLPFNQIIDLDDLSELCELQTKTDVVNLELKPRIQPDGYFKSFIVCAKLAIKVNAFCDNDVSVIYDAYSTKYDAEVTEQSIQFEKIIKNVNENFVCAKKLEFSDGTIDSVIDMWCENSRCSTATDSGNYIISGTVLICILARDNDHNAVYHERPVDYEYKFSIGEVNGELKCEPQISASIAGFSLSGSNCLDVRVQMNINATVFSCCKIPVVTNISVTGEAVKHPNSDVALYIYYAEKGEKLWNIARRYNSSKEEIMGINDLKDEELKTEKVLIVPVN